MKRLACEVCGGTELIKEDGVFVCENCGCKYSLEEVKKMMVEGTVKIDKSDEIQNLLKRAFMHLEEGKWDDAENSLEQVLNLDPEYAEAYVGKLMAELHTRKQEELGKKYKLLKKIDNYRKAYEFADDSLKEKLTQYEKSARYHFYYEQALEFLNKGLLQQVLKICDLVSDCEDVYDLRDLCEEKIYSLAISHMQSKESSDIESAKRLFERIKDYSDSAQKIAECENLITIFNQQEVEDKKKCDVLFSQLKDLYETTDNITTLKNKWSQIEPEMNSISEKIVERQNEIYSLKAEKSSLGFLDIKQKKNLTEKIEIAESEFSSLKQKLLKLKLKCIDKIRMKLTSCAYGKNVLEEYDKFLSFRNNLKNCQKGDVIEFGKLYNDIKWRVIDKKDDRVLVISEYLLYRKPYHTSRTNVTWETCSLRKWLNDDFINLVFSEEERKIIPALTVSADKNFEHHTNPGNETKDKVFLLSLAEAKKYFKSDISRQCKLTIHDRSNHRDCWLRSPGANEDHAALIVSSGFVHTYGSYVDLDDKGVRPALWIDLNDIE